MKACQNLKEACRKPETRTALTHQTPAGSGNVFKSINSNQALAQVGLAYSHCNPRDSLLFDTCQAADLLVLE